MSPKILLAKRDYDRAFSVVLIEGEIVRHAQHDQEV